MSESFFSKFEKIDRRIYYWLLVIALGVPFMAPIGLPITVKPDTRALFDGIGEVQEGEIVLMDIFMSVSTWTECMPGLVIETMLLMNQEAKLVFVSDSVDIGMTWDELNRRIPNLLEEMEYGVDIVLLGYYAGADAAVAQMAKDMSTVFPTDHFGTPVEDIPLMAEANTVEDYRMILGHAEGIFKYIQQWGAPYGVPIGMNGIAMQASQLAPYVSSGELFGMSSGSRGGAEMEQLYGKPGDATTRMDSISLSHLLVVILIILANLPLIAEKLGGGKT